MRLDPRHLEILAAIVDAGGLTEGAAKLGKSQPSVSRSIAFLEERVGQQLFEPRRRPLRPTELCLSLAAEGRKILDAGRAASALVQTFKSGEAGTVRVAGTPIFMDGVISGVIAEFQADHPNIRIDQSYAYIDEALEKLKQDQLDLAILPVRPGALPAEFEFRQILKGCNVIACRVDHPLTQHAEMTARDVIDYAWIAPPANSPLFQDMRALLESIGQRELKIGFTGGSLSAVLNVLAGSDSLTILPYSVVVTLQRRNQVASLPIEIGDPGRHLGIIINRSRSLHQAAIRFESFVGERIKGMSRSMASD